MDRWTERNSFVHGATLLSTRTKFTCRLMADIKLAYGLQHTVPADERGYLFGIPLSFRLLHSSSVEAWSDIYKAGHYSLLLLHRQDHCRQGTICQFLTLRNATRRPTSPPI